MAFQRCFKLAEFIGKLETCLCLEMCEALVVWQGIHLVSAWNGKIQQSQSPPCQTLQPAQSSPKGQSPDPREIQRPRPGAPFLKFQFIEPLWDYVALEMVIPGLFHYFYWQGFNPSSLIA